MNKVRIENFNDFISNVSSYSGAVIKLFRGQDRPAPLLPKIARDNPDRDTTNLEKQMLKDFQRRSAIHVGNNLDKWNLLVHAQHWGMATRLLDWTTNPLAALWFACVSAQGMNSAYVYIYVTNEGDYLDEESNSDPFSIKRTKIFKPTLNNPRIIAQSGWFTIHSYSKKSGKFVALETNRQYKRLIVELEIPIDIQMDCLRSLNTLNVNHASIFPDLAGTCLHINWEYKIKETDILVAALRSQQSDLDEPSPG